MAFAAHSRSRDRGGEETGDIPHHELLFALQELHPQKSLDWANRVVGTIEDRAGLLIAVAEHTFRFPHRSFQEYFAALHLIKDRPTWNVLVDLVDESGYWREVIKWAAGRIAHVDDGVDEKGFTLLRKLCPNDRPPGPHPWHRVWLAGEALLEMNVAKAGQFRDEGGPELITRIRGLLAQLLAEEALTPFERAQAGMTLGLLGDYREGVGTLSRRGKKAAPDLLWSLAIQPDEFIMGGEQEFEGKRRFTYRLQHPFCVAVYPVTVAQFELFIEDGGYEREYYQDDPTKRIWTVAGWQWREGEQRKRPDDYWSALQTPNHPRVGVAWYEAVAFCNWISAAFKAEELKLPEGWKVRLPTEAEWERAARHTDGRTYPWGSEDQAIEQRCNLNSPGLGQTSAVGLFPSGKAECDALDMAGNVWEWTRSLYRDYPYVSVEEREDLEPEGARVLRGGSWGGGADCARCAYRLRGYPVSRHLSFGFRVVASPFASGS